MPRILRPLLDLQQRYNTVSELQFSMEKNMRLAQQKHRKPFWGPVFNELRDKICCVVHCGKKRKREDMPM